MAKATPFKLNGSGALSQPSKMPGHSFSLPAGPTCPASKLSIKEFGAASTCSMCYAKQGNYRFKYVQIAQQNRFAAVRSSIAENAGQAFVDGMVAEIARVTKNRADKVFRIHDSGDFFNTAYVECWVRIAEALPGVRFWAPTREHLRPVMLPALRRLAALPNVTLRPSAPEVNTPAPEIEGLGPGSAVYALASDVPADHHICPATNSEDHTCDGHGCRRCWMKSGGPVVYMAHGNGARKLLSEAQAGATVASRRVLPILQPA